METELPSDMPTVTEQDLQDTIAEVFKTGANEIDPAEIFPDQFKRRSHKVAKNVPTMFPHEESTT